MRLTLTGIFDLQLFDPADPTTTLQEVAANLMAFAAIRVDGSVVVRWTRGVLKAEAWGQL